VINLPILAAAYALFHATHGIADYWFQVPYQANNKSKRGLLPFDLLSASMTGELEFNPRWTGWNTPLWSHILVYTLSFLPALLFLQSYNPGFNLWYALGSIALPHAWMDTRRFLSWFCHVTKGWNYPDTVNKMVSEVDMLGAAVKVHVTIEMDQKWHYASLLGTALYISWRP